MQHCIFEHCFVPIFENEPDFRMFYCTICGGWKKVSTSVAHIRVHFRSLSHDEDRYREEHEFSRRVGERLQKGVILFLLQNGLPFELVEDDQLQVVPNLPCRQRLKCIATLTARKILAILRSILQEVEYCTISIDEWADLKKDRYLGISCHTMVNGHLKAFTLRHLPINDAISHDGRDHISAMDLANLVECVTKDFLIAEKTLLVVTDNARIMSAAVTCLNDQRLTKHLPPVMWGCCVCHVVNLLLSDFVGIIVRDVGPVIQLQQKLMSSEVFQAFLTRRNSAVTRIPSYCSVRWYSLFSLFQGMKKCKDYILDYYVTENLGPIDAGIWETIEDVLPVLDVIKRSVKALEGENYATICYVLMAFDEVRKAIHSLLAKGAKYRETVEKADKCYSSRLAEMRKTWSPFLEVGCYLHPGLNHALYLTEGDMEKVRTFLQQDSEWVKLTLLSAVHQLSNTATVTRSRVQTSYTSSIDDSGVRVSITDTARAQTNSKKGTALSDLMNLAVQHQDTTQARVATIRDEMNAYSGLLQPGADPEQFWETNASQLPRLSAVARKVMAVIPSSASCERTFSISKRIEGLHRAHMNRKVFEEQVIICSNSAISEAAYDLVVSGK